MNRKVSGVGGGYTIVLCTDFLGVTRTDKTGVKVSCVTPSQMDPYRLPLP